MTEGFALELQNKTLNADITRGHHLQFLACTEVLIHQKILRRKRG